MGGLPCVADSLLPDNTSLKWAKTRGDLPPGTPIVVAFSEMNTFERFYTIIRRIPRCRVATYGQIARLAGLPRHSRHVGYALAALTNDEIPWHRVVNSKGEISQRSVPHFADRQWARLKKEGIHFDKKARIRLDRYQWQPNST